jgi:hypothetical protein
MEETQTRKNRAKLKRARASKVRQIVNILAIREWHTNFHQSNLDSKLYKHPTLQKHAQTIRQVNCEEFVFSS